MSDWSFVFGRFEPEHEGTREALCTLGNGYFATRGAAEEVAADGIHYPGTYLAGCYNRLRSKVAGREVENEDLINAPNWLPISFRIDHGPWFHPDDGELLQYRYQLDLRQGLLRRRLRVRDANGRITRIDSCRLVHMSRPHLAAIEYTVTAENWSGRLEFLSALDGRVRNLGVKRYRDLNNRHLRTVAQHMNSGRMELEVRTSQSNIHIALAARNRVFVGRHEVHAREQSELKSRYVAERIALELKAGQTARLEKRVALFTSRDRAISTPMLEAGFQIEHADDFAGLLQSHTMAWTQLWRRFDFELRLGPQAGDSDTIRLLRLHMFHLLQVATPNMQHVDAGIPARGLHGEAYRGHVFWDELFILPNLTFRMPEISRAALMYRWYRLDAAREAAREAGFRGALYPWQSGSNGREETQALHLNPRSGRWLPDNTFRQRHVSLAIAYNIWQYYEITGDHEFLATYGMEMLLEIARFWASIAEHDPADGRYHIRGVMGPDEYHDGYPHHPEPCGVDNNAYTNLLACWVLCQVPRLLDDLSQERCDAICAQLGLNEEELAHWDSVSRRLRVDFHDGHIISQFQGYGELQEFDWEGYCARYGNIQRLDRILEAEGDTPNRYKLSKQADVLMLFYLFSAEQLEELFAHLGYRFERHWIPDNVAYYHQRDSHGSSLSRVGHAWILSRTHRSQSWNLFEEALHTDYDGTARGTTQEGIHLGAMAGTIDLMFRCYTGLEVRDETLWLKPRLPAEVTHLCMRLHFRGRSIKLVFEGDKLTATVAGHAEGLHIGVRDVLHKVSPGQPRNFDLPRHGDDEGLELPTRI